MSRLYVFVLVAVLCFSVNGWSHGEEKPGPNGGYVRMPGPFHTEVVQIKKNVLKVFLLDMQWQNPSTNDSSLVVALKSGATSNKATSGKAIAVTAKCVVPSSAAGAGSFYVCEFSDGVDLAKKGELKVLAQREGLKGAEVSYALPLSLKSAHGSH